MLEIIKKLDAGTVRGLIVATIPLLVLIGSFFGLDQAVFSAKLSDIGEKIVALVTLGGIAWAAYARLFNPTPPITETAAEKTRAMLAKQNEGKSSSSGAPPVRLHPVTLVLALVLASLAFSSIYGCSSLAVSRAKTNEQRAAALIGDFTIFQRAAIAIGQDSTVPTEVRKPIVDSAVQLKPAVDELDLALREYRSIVFDLGSDTSSDQKLAIAAANLTKWIAEIQPRILALRSLIERRSHS